MELTRALANFVVRSRYEDIPETVRHEARRSLVNWMGCALGGARHEAVTTALNALRPFAGRDQAQVVGRSDRLDCLNAALVNGMSAHVLDFDDTHLRTLVHPSVPVASSLLALAERQPMCGTDFLHAFILGVDVECRVANAIYASHNVNGYITGTAGVLGAAAAAGRVLDLDEKRMCWAMGAAATQGAGLREMAGTMCKSFVHGRAAQNGMVAALLASRGFTSSERALEAPRGLMQVIAPGCDHRVVLDGLGESYEITLNTYKPYACGVVCHPAIDGCLALRAHPAFDLRGISAVALSVHPLALKLTGIERPRSGLESKWSIYHSAAVALCDGVAGEAQYTNARVMDAGVTRIRGMVTAEADPALRDDEAHVSITLADGTRLSKHVAHALGSVENPMTDRQLDAKFAALAHEVLDKGRRGQLLAACWTVDGLRDVSELARLSCPEPGLYRGSGA
jgi:2-methylcitrate dehydratase PrpD